MQFQHHVSLTLGALRRWLVAQLYDSLIVGLFWLAAMLWLKVPWAPFWAILAGTLQFIPHFGPLLGLIGPALAMLFAGASVRSWFWFLGAYALITALDALLLQPILMRRQNRVPFWASLVSPILLGIIFPFWGVLLAPPLLAIVYAYRGTPKSKAPSGEQKFSANDTGIVLSPEDRSGPGE